MCNTCTLTHTNLYNIFIHNNYFHTHTDIHIHAVTMSFQDGGYFFGITFCAVHYSNSIYNHYNKIYTTSKSPKWSLSHSWSQLWLEITCILYDISPPNPHQNSRNSMLSLLLWILHYNILGEKFNNSMMVSLVR